MTATTVSNRTWRAGLTLGGAAVAGGALARELAAGRRLRGLLDARVCGALPGGELVLAEPRPWAFCTGLARRRL